MTAVVLLLSLLCAITSSAAPQYRVSLVTVDPGASYYELEGHSGLRIQGDGLDVVVNWGVFDFNSPNFLYRFVSGDTEYLCVAEPTEYFLNRYRMFSPGRGVTEQLIPLDEEQSQALVDALRVNLLPENRHYHYNYVRDNCATRPLLMLQKSAGRPLVTDAIPDGFTSGDSFRDVMRHFHANYPWYQFGIDLALGSGIDRPLSNQEFLFAPVLLREMMPMESITLIPAKEGGVVSGPTPALLTPIAVMSLIFLLIILSLIAGNPHGKLVRWTYTIWFSVLFITGLVVAFLVFISKHEATTPNFNLLWINPLTIAGILSVWFNKPKKVWICYHFANFATVITYAIIWITGIQQGNTAFIPLLAADALLSAYYILTHRNTSQRLIRKNA